MGKRDNQNTYTQSLSASHVWEHMNRGNYIKADYSGMIPYSLELIKLKKVMKNTNKTLKDDKLKVHTVKETGKQITDAVINLKFDSGVKSGDEIISIMKNKLLEMEGEEANNYASKIKQLQETIKANRDDWEGVRINSLRERLYEDGFTITDEDGAETHYKAYKRSSSKSRTGQCLFIHESIYDEMVKWSRMGIEFDENKEIDFASLLAYESLVGSSIEDTVTINPKNILIVDDVFSTFNVDANVVRKNDETGLLDSFPKKNVEISNNIFDGQSLLDTSVFKETEDYKDKGFILLRNHMFKSAAFHTNIQKFLQDYARKNGINFDKWTIPNMFGQRIKAKNVLMITTPSSLKALKFSNDIFGDKENPQREMWNYWKKVVNKDNKIFGICKSESESKRGKDQYGNVLQQMSYQMINSIPFTYEEVNDLSEYEVQYIDDLKNDDNTFITYLSKNANEMNSNEMLVDLYRRNNDITKTEIFKDFRKKEINKYVTHVKKGKLRLPGDYCVLIGNPMEMLLHSVGKYDVNKTKLSLKDNQVYTTMFEFGKEYVAFRNPHTSPSNVLVVENTYNENIDKYFNLTDNIVCVNAVRFEIQDILSGADYDSDTMAIFDHKVLLQAAKKVYGDYNVCINDVDSEKAKYEPTMGNMAAIDNTLSKSQIYIGLIVNIAQQCMSKYWDGLTTGKDEKYLSGLLKKVSVLTICSGICIDMAKQMYKMNMQKEIKNIDTDDIYKMGNKNKRLNPLFFKYVKQSETISKRITNYNTPMDHLYKVLEKLEYANHRETIDFSELLVRESNTRKVDYRQIKKVMSYVKEMDCRLKEAYSQMNNNKDNDEVEKEGLNRVDNTIKYFEFYIEKLTVQPSTMHVLLNRLAKNEDKDVPVIRLMNVLYKTQKETFINSFEKGMKIQKSA